MIGIGKFTIADKAIVNEADLGVNFFLEEESLGRSRAEQCVKLLQELNPDVMGDWYPKHQARFKPIYPSTDMLTRCVCRMTTFTKSSRKITQKNIL